MVQHGHVWKSDESGGALSASSRRQMRAALFRRSDPVSLTSPSSSRCAAASLRRKPPRCYARSLTCGRKVRTHIASARHTTRPWVLFGPPARADGTADYFVRLVDVEMNRHRSPADRLRSLDAVLRELVCQHWRGFVKVELSMPRRPPCKVTFAPGERAGGIRLARLRKRPSLASFLLRRNYT